MTRGEARRDMTFSLAKELGLGPHDSCSTKSTDTEAPGGDRG